MPIDQDTAPDLTAKDAGNSPALQMVVDVLLAAFPQAFAIYAFGSRVRGDSLPDSDLDLAILVPGYGDPHRLWELSAELAGRLGYYVDLLDMRAATTVMQSQVLDHGIKLWSLEPQAGLFECFVSSEKLSLDARCAGLLVDIEARGSVYGG